MSMFHHPLWLLMSQKEFIAVVYAIACLKIIVG